MQKHLIAIDYPLLSDVFSDMHYAKEITTYLNKTIDEELKKGSCADTVLIDDCVQILNKVRNRILKF